MLECKTVADKTAATDIAAGVGNIDVMNITYNQVNVLTLTNQLFEAVFKIKGPLVIDSDPKNDLNPISVECIQIVMPFYLY